MLRMKQVVIAALCVVFLGAASSPMAPPLWGSLRPGAYGVGFTSYYAYDYSRSWSVQTNFWGEELSRRPRPIRVSVWYPAKTPVPGIQHFGRYVSYGATKNADFNAANAFLTMRDTQNYLRGDFHGDRALLRRLMTSPTAAVDGGRHASGRFPLILYAAGWNSFSPDNSILCEYLASHGFVVATVPQLPAQSGQAELPATLSGLETQLRDLQTARGVASDLPFVDSSRIGIIGYSMGGVVALWLAMQDSNVRMVAGLDPSFAVQTYVPLSETPAKFAPGNMRAPVMVLQSGSAEAAASHSAEVLDKLVYSTIYAAPIGRSTHGDFSDFPAISRYIGGVAPLGETRAEAQRSHDTIDGCMLTFADAFLRLDAPSRELLNGGRCDDKQQTALLTRREGAQIPTTAEFIRLAHDRGFDAAQRYYGQLRQRYSDLQIVDENAMNVAGYRLLDQRDPADAISAFRLNVLAHPLSANTYDSLVDGYLARGDRPAAKSTYRQMLAIIDRDPSLSPPAKQNLIDRAKALLAQP